MAHPTLYQIHARDWLWRNSPTDTLITLDQLPDSELDRLAGFGFNWVYLLGIWQTGTVGAQISQDQPDWRDSFSAALPDWKETDVVGSPFAVTAYRVHRDFGGNTALAILRQKLRARGIKLILDFVANHTAIDHPWVNEHPEFYVSGIEQDLARAPQNYIRLADNKIFAHGRDPYFPGWPDTLQLNYGNSSLQQAMSSELRAISTMCDGVRCDMAMLILPEIFQKTWNIPSHEFWVQAIFSIRKEHPDFLFLAEVYWRLEWVLQQRGFDYTYDKELLDRLLGRKAERVRTQLTASFDFQARSGRFLENHDEQRIAAALPLEIHKAAAIIAYLIPGLGFFQDGQLLGYVRKPSIHLSHRALEKPNPDLEHFYQALLKIRPVVCCESWQLLDTVPAWDTNPTFRDFICFCWFKTGQLAYLIVVNYSDHASQCYAKFPPCCLGIGTVELRDLMSPEFYRRDSAQVEAAGLYLALPSWGFNVFRVTLSDS